MTPLLGTGFASLGYTLMVVLGIGFLIFWHELGHFIAAKASGVRVEVFAIGMGPRVFGWRRGETDYRFCLLPIGGYVRMYGEAPGEGDPGDPRSLNNASVGWRFVIFSGGVVMNLLFALVAFPLAFNSGVPFTAPVAGDVEPGSPAWEAGLRAGDRVLRIDGQPVYSFDQIMMESALSGNKGLRLRVQRGDEEFDATVHPRFNARAGLKSLGLFAASRDTGTVVLTGDGPAKAAGLETGDRIVRDFGEPFTVEARERLLREQTQDPLRWTKAARPVVVEREGKEIAVEIRPKVTPGTRPRLGIMLRTAKVLGLRRGKAKKLDVAAIGLRVGDIILAVRSGGRSRIVTDEASLTELLRTAQSPAALEVLRAGAGATERGAAARKLLELPATLVGPKGAQHLVDAVALGGDDLSGRVVVQPGLAAAKLGLRSGARILSLGSRDVRSWNDIVQAVTEAQGKPLAMRWQGWSEDPKAPASEVETEITPETVPFPDYGFLVQIPMLMETYAVEGFTQSLLAGWRSSMDTLRNLYVTLKRILGGSVSADNLGGIITISRVSYDYAQSGWQRFLWFLAMLSLNLAFINVLPIPVLDGGQLMFLLIEKIKGSPVSVRVMTYAQILGIVMVLGLLIFVTYNDILRLFR